MLVRVAARLAGMIATLLGVSALIFLVMEVLPGDPAAVSLGTSASPETLAALRAAMGLDRPALWRYLGWLGGLLTGDVGLSLTYHVPVIGLIAERLAVTLPLALLALALSTAIAIPLGTLAAARPGGPADRLALLFGQLFIAVPAFWLGILLIGLFAVHLGLAPAGGFPGWQAGAGPGLAALILPAIALALPQAAVLVRVTRRAVADVLGEDYIRTARAKGLTAREALWRHALPNALIPVTTIMGLQFSFLVAGTVLVENVFSLPGLGRLAYQALVQRDLMVIETVVMVFAATVILVNGAVGLLHLRLDPRLAGRHP